MLRLQNFHRVALKASLIGLAAFVLNLTAQLIIPGRQISIGNVLLFLAAEALGPLGAFSAVCVAELPNLVLSPNLWWVCNAVKILLLTLSISYGVRRFAQTPAFVFVLAAWVFVIGPTSLLLENVRNIIGSEREFLLSALVDVALSVIASTALLNSTIWNRLTDQLRHVSLQNKIVHVLVSCSTLTLLCALLLPFAGGTNALNLVVDPSGALFLGAVLVASIVFPVLLGTQLALTIDREVQDMAPGLLPNKRMLTFSGLSSEYWRRQNLDDEAKTMIAGIPVDSSGNNPAPSASSTPGLVPPDHGICAINRNGTITFLNRRFRRLAEITTNDVIGKNIENIAMNPILRKQISLLIEGTFSKGPRVIEVKANQLPDKLRYFEVSTQRADRLENSSMSDGPDSIIVTIKDITDRRTVESHLFQAKKVEALGAIVSGIAHSFNNALTSITGQASLARQDENSPKLRGALDNIISLAQGAGQVVRQLLDFAHDTPNLMSPEDLRKVIQDRLEFLDKSVGEDIEIVFEPSADSIMVVCNTNLLMQAITNLILNSKEAYPKGTGKIVISLDTEEIPDEISEVHMGARPGMFARLRVKDFGLGMSPETLSKAFDPLFTTKSSSGHTGLGLSIVFAIIRSHDGFLTAESHPEKGTTVTLYIPVAAADVLHPNTSASQSAKASTTLTMGNGEKILLVEDEPGVREMVSMMLSALNYSVISCCNGSEAVEKAQSEKFAVVITDLLLPKMGGSEVVTRIREASPVTKAIIMTGYGSSGDSNDSSTKVLSKPFDVETLSEAVREALVS